jgi:ACS family tartrate transporter-like MFS transporter
MLLWGRHSDRKGERVGHVALPILMTITGLVAAIVWPGGIVSLVALAVASVGIYATLGPFWGLPPIFLTQTAAAGGIALINSVGNLGGFLGPSIVGWALETTRSSAAGLMVITACLIVSAIAVILVGWRVRMPAPATTDASP